MSIVEEDFVVDHHDLHLIVFESIDFFLLLNPLMFFLIVEYHYLINQFDFVIDLFVFGNHLLMFHSIVSLKIEENK